MGRVYEKAAQDDIFFLAGGISFYAMIAAGPFLLLLIAASGLILRATIDDPAQVAVEYVLSILPATERLLEMTEMFVNDVIAGSTGFGVLGLLLFIWFSTSLIGSLRVALRDIFDLQEDRGIVAGKLFDAQMVLVAGFLLLTNTGITVALEAIGTFGVQWLAVGRGELRFFQTLSAQLLAFAFIFLMFLLIYRYLPPRRTPWRVSLVAAAFTSVAWELLKASFAWYVANVARYTTAYGNLATLIILFFWIYYSAVVFILGGEVAKVYEMQRTRRRQKEMLE
ncbi:MAG: YihY/virulence factor BrkB family protein [Longimicrobiaceae bacterium]